MQGSLDEQPVYINYLSKESNERLEYLGDHILKATLGRYLYQRFGTEREGFLTRLKIKIEKCSMLHKFAVTLGFKEFLLLSLQIENQTLLDLDRGRNTPSYYEDAFESFLGSIMEDFEEKGYIYAERFLRNIIENIIDFSELISKNDLFEMAADLSKQVKETPKEIIFYDLDAFNLKTYSNEKKVFQKDLFVSLENIVDKLLIVF